MSIESHCTTDCNITANTCVTIYHKCIVNLLFVAQNGLGRNGLIEAIEPHLFRENSNAFLWHFASTFQEIYLSTPSF